MAADRWFVGCGVLLLALGISACGGDQGEDDAAAGSSGTVGSGGSAGSTATGGAGTGGSTSTGGGSIVLGGTGGMDVATIPVDPPATVDLELCKAISEDQPESFSECFYCCAEAGFRNHGFFQGSCACGHSAAGEEVCADQTDSETCSECCRAADYWGGGYTQDPPDCDCSSHQDDDVCAAQTGDGNCAVCCLNAGYVSHLYSGGCSCRDG